MSPAGESRLFTAQPVLETDRLRLRPFVLADAARVQLLAGDERIADVPQTFHTPTPTGWQKPG